MVYGRIHRWFVAAVAVHLLVPSLVHAQQLRRSIHTPNQPSAPSWLQVDDVHVAQTSVSDIGGFELPIPIEPDPVKATTATSTLIDTRHVIPFSISDGDFDISSKGENVSLVARDASLKEMLAMLAKSQKLNLVFANTAVTSGGAVGAGAGAGGGGGQPNDVKITVSLEDVPLDTALDTILSVAGFTWTRSQGVILVTPNSLSAKLAPNAQGRTMRVFELDFGVAEDVDLAVKGLLSPVGQSFVTASVSNDSLRSKELIVVEDLPRYVERIASYIGQIDVPPRQVALQVYVLEVDLDSNLRHGVNLQNIARLVDPNLRLGVTGFARNNPGQAFFLELDGDYLDGFLEALRTTVDAKTLAAPRIIAVNGQDSRLQVGEQLGFRVTTTTQTSTLESVEFLNVGVVLTVTPRISRDGRVLLRVRPEVSSGQVNPETGLPEEETAELETDVLLDDGQGIIVGGLIKEELSDVQSKVPVIGDLPYVGALFERRDDERSRSEIIVALVPKILPLDPEHEMMNQLELERATSPLLNGSLVENPRPFEPSLPDPLRKPVRHWSQAKDHRDHRQANRYSQQQPNRTEIRNPGLRPPASIPTPAKRWSARSVMQKLHRITTHHR